MTRTWILSAGVRIDYLLFGRSNVFLVSQGGRFLLVDTSWRFERRRLLSRLAAFGVHPGMLVALVLTHTHYDHAENAAGLKAGYAPQIIVQRQEADFLRQGDSRLPGGAFWLTRPLMKLLAPRLRPFFRYPPVEPDIVVDEQWDVRTLGFDASLLHTPGHSPGSMSLIVGTPPEIAIVGDAMIGVFPGSVYPPYGDDPALLVRSWKKLLDTGCRLFLPAHGTANSRALLERQYNKHNGGKK